MCINYEIKKSQFKSHFPKYFHVCLCTQFHQQFTETSYINT